MWTRVLLLCACASAVEIFKEEYVWSTLDFTWPDDGSKAQALDHRQYQPENVVVTDVRAWRNMLYLTLPRLRAGVPATLVSVAATRLDGPSPRLKPFPSWEMQATGNCSALQSVYAVEVDRKGQMWVLDAGRVNVLDAPDNRCPPKIVLFDLNSVAENPNAAAKILHVFMFPDSVLSNKNDSLLVNLVLDSDDVLYISDASETDPGIIVFNAGAGGRAWKMQDFSSMMGDPQASIGRRATFQSNMNALSLTPVPLDGSKNRTLYYSPLYSYMLYSIPTSILRDQSAVSSNSVSRFIMNLGNKTSYSQAMIIDSHQVLYYGLNSKDSIARWDTTKLPLKDNIHVISQDAERLQWPSGFSFDTSGNLWVVSNRLQNFIAGKVELRDTNYRVMRAVTNTTSYLYPDDRVPGSIQPTMSTEHSQDHDHDHDHGQGHMQNHSHGINSAVAFMTSHSGVAWSLLSSLAALILANA